MANAGCINAYDCNGCLIQTLQNLDSACIGVGVQYTAPNPLDDKRLDYIKYTDKCGCVQCLSAENEILIYATNGVIKNLTLTNDDVNKAIKIKWNDIFGSNRAKTIVRYKTGSYPVSITDGTLAVEETTKNQYSSTPFSLSGVLDETTYYITAFAVDSNNAVISSQQATITTDFGWHPSANTLLYVPFESDLLDHSQNAISLVKTGTVNINTSQASIGVGYFNGGYFAINNSGILSHMQYNRTFSVRIKTSPTNVIFSKNSQGGDLWLGMPFDTSNESGGLARGMKQSQGPNGDLGTRNGTAYNGNWHLITYTYEHSSGMRKIYCDGVLLASSSNYAKMGSQGTSYLIGKNPTEPDFRFYGYMSKLIIENKIRNITEISDYYNKTKKHYS